MLLNWAFQSSPKPMPVPPGACRYTCGYVYYCVSNQAAWELICKFQDMWLSQNVGEFHNGNFVSKAMKYLCIVSSMSSGHLYYFIMHFPKHGTLNRRRAESPQKRNPQGECTALLGCTVVGRAFQQWLAEPWPARLCHQNRWPPHWPRCTLEKRSCRGQLWAGIQIQLLCSLPCKQCKSWLQSGGRSLEVKRMNSLCRLW